MVQAASSVGTVGGEPRAPRLRTGDFHYTFDKSFDWSFPGLRGSSPIVDSWWMGVGNGVCSGGDVARAPVVVVDGPVGSSNPYDVWVEYKRATPGWFWWAAAGGMALWLVIATIVHVRTGRDVLPVLGAMWVFVFGSLYSHLRRR